MQCSTLRRESQRGFEIQSIFSYLCLMKQVAVGVIINKDRVLACQRKRDAKYPLKWEFPGGKLEQGETAEVAVVRELREELNIEAVVESELLRQDWTYPNGASSSSNDGAFRVFYFLIGKFSGTPVNNAFEQIRWVTPAELSGMDILEGNRRAVELVLANANNTEQEIQTNRQE
jgi:8-oxo-dGTP diphosphatase